MNKETYKDGYVSCTLRYANTNIPPLELDFQFDVIRPNEEKKSWLVDLTAYTTGSDLLHDFNLICKGKLVVRGDYTLGSTIPCHCFINSMDQAIDKDNPLIFNVASREELYQKYSVVVAICASIISIIISTIALIKS